MAEVGFGRARRSESGTAVIPGEAYFGVGEVVAVDAESESQEHLKDVSKATVHLQTSRLAGLNPNSSKQSLLLARVGRLLTLSVGFLVIYSRSTRRAVDMLSLVVGELRALSLTSPSKSQHGLRD